MAEPTTETVRALLGYDPETGVFVWRERPIRIGKERSDKCWNARFAGKVAGRLSLSGYWDIAIHSKLYRAHRLAWFYVHGQWPPDQIDHINRNRSDNRISNLRLATGTQNQGNRDVDRANKSGFKGVSWNRRRNKWVAQLGGARRYLGQFDNPKLAAKIYNEAAKEYFGEFACLGGIDG